MTRIASILPEEKTAAKVHSSFIQPLVDRVFGYDFFISYARKDAYVYASGLKSELARRGYRCFLDREGFDAGASLGIATRHILKTTTSLILVGSPLSLKSGYVLSEVAIFDKMGRKIIPVDIGGTLANQNSELRSILGDRIRIEEESGTLGSGPSEQVIGAVLQSFKATRQDTKRIRIFGGAAALFALVAVVAVVLALKASAATKQAEERRIEAQRQEGIANEERLKAENNLREANRQEAIAKAKSQELERQVVETVKQKNIALYQANIARRNFQSSLSITRRVTDNYLIELLHTTGYPGKDVAKLLLTISDDLSGIDPDMTIPDVQILRFRILQGLRFQGLYLGEVAENDGSLIQCSEIISMLARTAPDRLSEIDSLSCFNSLLVAIKFARSPILQGRYSRVCDVKYERLLIDLVEVAKLTWGTSRDREYHRKQILEIIELFDEGPLEFLFYSCEGAKEVDMEKALKELEDIIAK